jgi:hypothetical protein
MPRPTQGRGVFSGTPLSLCRGRIGPSGAAGIGEREVRLLVRDLGGVGPQRQCRVGAAELDRARSGALGPARRPQRREATGKEDVRQVFSLARPLERRSARVSRYVPMASEAAGVPAGGGSGSRREAQNAREAASAASPTSMRERAERKT